MAFEVKYFNTTYSAVLKKFYLDTDASFCGIKISMFLL